MGKNGKTDWLTFLRCLLTHLVNVFFWMASRSSVKKHREQEDVSSHERINKSHTHKCSHNHFGFPFRWCAMSETVRFNILYNSIYTIIISNNNNNNLMGFYIVEHGLTNQLPLDTIQLLPAGSWLRHGNGKKIIINRANGVSEPRQVSEHPDLTWWPFPARGGLDFYFFFSLVSQKRVALGFSLIILASQRLIGSLEPNKKSVS